MVCTSASCELMVDLVASLPVYKIRPYLIHSLLDLCKVSESQ
uniref:Uncharacterized protein n=1 Tax=Anguilla anguilla TaxID=7936 RepID=A0A0E9VLS1_ANGAN